MEGRPREIVVFSRETQPVSVAMVLDQSGSVTREDRERIRQAAQVFVGYMRPGDRASIGTLSFDCQPLTEDRGLLATALPSALLRDAGSPIWHAVGRGINSLSAESSRRAILLL